MAIRLLARAVVCGAIGHLAVAFSLPAVAQDEPMAVKERVRLEAKGYIRLWGISPDGKSLAYSESTSSGKGRREAEAVLFDLQTLKERKRGKGNYGTSSVWAPNGDLLAVSRPGSAESPVHIWDVKRWERIRALDIPENDGFFRPVAFSLDSKKLVGIARPKDRAVPFVVLWELETGKSRVVLKPDFERRDSFPGILRLGGHDGVLPARPVFCFHDEYDPIGLGRFTDTDKYRGRLTPSGWPLLLPHKSYQWPFLYLHELPKNRVAVVLSDSPVVGVEFPGKHLYVFEHFRDAKLPPTFLLTPDCRTVVAAGTDDDGLRSTIYIWDISALHKIGNRWLKGSSAAEQRALKDSLFLHQAFEHKRTPEFFRKAAEPPWQEHQKLACRGAILLAAEGDEGASWIRKQLGPPLNAKLIPGWVENLSSSEKAKRENATDGLNRAGHAALPLLEEALKKDGGKTLALVDLVKRLRETLASHELNVCRIIDVLEHMKTPAARDLLRDLAGGGYGTLWAEEARSALKRVPLD